jgi:hypothetical protein
MHYFIHGPSGSGKSCLSDQLARSKGALLIEIDLWPPCDGMVEVGLKSEWDQFWAHHLYPPIGAELDRRADQANATGCVISLPGCPLLTTVHAAQAAGRARIVYLVGTPGLDAFLARERATGRGLGIEHWALNLRGFFQALERPEIAPLAVSSFESDGRHRSSQDIITDIDGTT